MRAASTARISSSLLVDGSLNAWPRLRLATAKKNTSRIPWTIAPARALSPTAATPAVGSTPDFCRKRAFSAIPPTLAGDTRLMNDDAAWVRTVGQNGTRPGTPPSRETALAR